MQHAWVSHPMASGLLAFNALPSRFLHGSRMAELMPFGQPPEVLDAQFHRHCSALLLPGLDSQPVLAMEDPALPLAMLPPETFAQLLQLCGVLLLAPSIQRVIARDEARALQQGLGKQAVDFAYFQAPGLLELPFVSQEKTGFTAGQAKAQAVLWGAALLHAAFASAPKNISQRGFLRLPAEAAQLRQQMPAAAVQSNAQALSIARSITQTLEPQWLSSFPTLH